MRLPTCMKSAVEFRAVFHSRAEWESYWKGSQNAACVGEAPFGDLEFRNYALFVIAVPPRGVVDITAAGRDSAEYSHIDVSVVSMGEDCLSTLDEGWSLYAFRLPRVIPKSTPLFRDHPVPRSCEPRP
jgi:hypothetical protein